MLVKLATLIVLGEVIMKTVGIIDALLLIELSQVPKHLFWNIQACNLVVVYRIVGHSVAAEDDRRHA